MFNDLHPAQWLIGSVLIGSAFGVIAAKKPVHSALFFMLTLVMLAALYLQLSAEFIAVMQVLVYAGAILVLFVFVIVLFQDAHQQISLHQAQSPRWLMILAATALPCALLYLSTELEKITIQKKLLPASFGHVESLGRTLYLDFFLPFESVIVLFLIALVGALYIGKKVR